MDKLTLVGSRAGGRVGQAEEKVDLNKVKGRQIRRDMMVEEERQHMDAYDMEYMDVEGEEEEIQAKLSIKYS